MTSDPNQHRQREFEALLLARELEDFLYVEAELLDQRRFEEWLDLLTDDIRYFMPMRRNVKFDELEEENTREGRDMNWFDEGKDLLAKRVRQIRTGKHWAEEPLSRVSHLISNVRVVSVNGAAMDEAHVECRFLVYRNRMQAENDIFVGKRRDVLRRIAGHWKVARREIILDQNVLLAKNLTIFF